MFSNEEIESFLHGNDPEEFIVAVEFDYASNSVYKIKEPPGKPKTIQRDTFIAFAWVGDLHGLNFYQSSKDLQKKAGKIPDDLHIPYIDSVQYKCICGGLMKRIPDVLDVWIDAGTTSWSCLDYPQRDDLFKKLFM